MWREREVEEVPQLSEQPPCLGEGASSFPRVFIPHKNKGAPLAERREGGREGGRAAPCIGYITGEHERGREAAGPIHMPREEWVFGNTDSFSEHHFRGGESEMHYFCWRRSHE